GAHPLHATNLARASNVQLQNDIPRLTPSVTLVATHQVTPRFPRRPLNLLPRMRARKGWYRNNHPRLRMGRLFEFDGTGDVACGLVMEGDIAITEFDGRGIGLRAFGSPRTRRQ